MTVFYCVCYHLAMITAKCDAVRRSEHIEAMKQ